MRRVFICGSALTGQPNHDNLQGARLVGIAATTPDYRLHSAANDWHPAIYRVEQGGIPIPGEVYEMTEEQFTYLNDHEPPHMEGVEVLLADGSTAIMFMYPQAKVEEYGWPDISHYGGWAAYMAAHDNPVP